MAPFAEYAVTSAPEWVRFRFPEGEPAVLTARTELLVSRREGDGIFIFGGDDRLIDFGWGGIRNHSISFRTGAWEVSHLGHGRGIWLNGVSWNPAAGTSHSRPLASGDRFEPATGFAFTFTLRPELEVLWRELGALSSPAAEGCARRLGDAAHGPRPKWGRARLSPLRDPPLITAE